MCQQVWPGSNLAGNKNGLVKVYPAIKYKVYVSFNVDDCKKMNIEVLGEDNLDKIIEIISNEKTELFKSKENLLKLSLDEKKSIVHEYGQFYILNGYLKTLSATDIEYYKNLFLSLNCIVNLKFQIVEGELYSKITPAYKISICGTNEHIIKTSLNHVSQSFPSLGENPNHCFIAIDDEELKLDYEVLQFRKNTLGQELLRCLGLSLPSYKSLRENIAHRSIMENNSPIIKKCQSKNLFGTDFFKCINLPTMPTGEDVCALNNLYGKSFNTSSVCNGVVQNFVDKYPYVAVETYGSDSAYNSEL